MRAPVLFERQAILGLPVLLLAACMHQPVTQPLRDSVAMSPARIVDLGAPITERLPEQVWGRALLHDMGFTKPNAFDVRRWSFPAAGGSIEGSNAYYTLFNHGGPHVDAPSHFSLGGGIDSYSIEAFTGPVTVFDVRNYPPGRSVPVDVFRGHVAGGDVVLLLTGYTPPSSDAGRPQVITVTHEAAEWLATIPIRAIGTDAFSIDSLGDVSVPSIHHVFLTRVIPVYEQLFNVGAVPAKGGYFVGVPLNIPAGDGMLVRPVVLVYQPSHGRIQ